MEFKKWKMKIEIKCSKNADFFEGKKTFLIYIGFRSMFDETTNKIFTEMW